MLPCEPSLNQSVGASRSLSLLLLMCGFIQIAVGRDVALEWFTAHQYSKQGVVTTGKVVETHPDDADRILVDYFVGAQRHRCYTQGEHGARDYAIGDAVNVYYYGAYPVSAFLEKPVWRPWRDLLLLLIPSSVIACILVISRVVRRVRPLRFNDSRGADEI